MSLDEVARFLSGFAPFDALPAEEVEALAASTRIEAVRRGERILQDGTFVVRAGAVELLDGEAVIDVLGPGELLGHRSMLSGLPAGAVARAAEDSLLYRLAGDVARPLLARPRAADITRTGIGGLVEGPALVCAPDTTIRAAAERMTAAGQDSVVVPVDGGWGMLTDVDLRAKVVAGPLSPDDPVSAAMTAPAFTVDSDRHASEVLLEMLDRGVRHVPVLDRDGRMAGVVGAGDLLAAQPHAAFLLRDAVAGARSVEELAVAARDRTPTVVALHGAGIDANHVGATLAVLDDAIVRRLVELGREAVGEPPLPAGWIVFGSGARRETALSSDVDCGMYWLDSDDAGRAGAAQEWATALARFVLDGLAACGLKVDDKGVRADDPLVARPLSAWRRLVDLLAEDPWQTNAIALVSVLADGRAVTGPGDATALIGLVREAVNRPRVRQLLLRVALKEPEPHGLLHSASLRHPLGAAASPVDLKLRGITPIVDLARWAGITAGVTANATQPRLRGAAAAGVFDEADARALIEAHLLVCELRLDHQVAQVVAGEAPDNRIDEATLDPLTRTYLREALREVRHVRHRLRRREPGA